MNNNLLPATLAMNSPIKVVSQTGSVVRGAIDEKFKLKRGGAGTVYEHRDLPGEVIKIYNDFKLADEHAGKVEAMIKAPPKAIRTRLGAVQIAWPSASVIVDGRFLGFTMPKVDFSQAWTLQNLIKPTQRSRLGIPERMVLRLYAGRNVAIILQSLHQMQHYAIDLKPQNLLVYRDDSYNSAAQVVLVDCDGFQISDSQKGRHDAKLVTPEFVHPSLKTMADINNHADLQDDFALAVVLFQLLNNSLHPMSGRETGQRNAIPSNLADRLKEAGRYYAYASGRLNPLISPDETSLHKWFHPTLSACFDKAFLGNKPPTAEEWVQVLGDLCERSNFCSLSDDHWKLGPVCGQCAIEQINAKRALALPSQIPLPPRTQSSTSRSNQTKTASTQKYVPKPWPATASTTIQPARSKNWTLWAAIAAFIALIWLGASQSGPASSTVQPTTQAGSELSTDQDQQPDQQSTSSDTPAPQPVATPSESQTSTNSTNQAPGQTINPLTGPSFPCPQPTDPLAQLICSNSELSALDMQFVQVYEALIQQAGTGGEANIRAEDLKFVNQVENSCGIASSEASNPSGGIPPSAPAGAENCVIPAYERQIQVWKGMLFGPALDEGDRSIQDQVALQTRLQSLGFLNSAAPIDGIFGSGTRAAILQWQNSVGRPTTGLLSNDDAQILLTTDASPTNAAQNKDSSQQSAPVSQPNSGNDPSQSSPPSSPSSNSQTGGGDGSGAYPNDDQNAQQALPASSGDGDQQTKSTVTNAWVNGN